MTAQLDQRAEQDAPKLQAGVQSHVSLEEIAAYLRRKLPHLADWPALDAVRVLRWFAERDLVRATRDAQGALAGVVVARRVPEGHDAEGELRYTHDERGATLWVEWVAAEDRPTLARLLAELPRRWPDAPQTISGIRKGDAQFPRTFDVARLRRALGDDSPPEL